MHRRGKDLFSTTCEGKQDREKERRLPFILHSRDLNVENFTSCTLRERGVEAYKKSQT